MKNNKGFSLVELIVVIAIMAILVGVAVPVFSSYVEKSAKEKDIALVDEMADAIVLANNSGHIPFAVEGQYEKGIQIPVGYIVISDTKIDGDNYVKVYGENADLLAQALSDKFGANFASDLSLTYDGWNGSAGSFFGNAESMIGTIKTTASDTLELLHDDLNKNLWGNGFVYKDGKVAFKVLGYEVAGKQVLYQDYPDSASLLLSVADRVSRVTQVTFVTRWDELTSPSEEFGLQSVKGDDGKVISGREHYSAVRAAYNNCFAAFVESKKATYTYNGNPHTDFATHALQIRNYGQSASELLGDTFGEYSDALATLAGITATFPQAVSASAWDTPNADYSFTSCDHCKELLKEYKSSDQDKSDATNFYNTMVSGKEYGQDIYDKDTSADKSGLFNWMTEQVGSFADATEAINTDVEGKSAIVLTVYYTKEGQIVVDYTPIDATP